MTQQVRSTDEPDQALVHQFIRLFGRVPTPTELERYERARTRVRLRLPHRVRREAARIVSRT
jgi:hypothetical protein